MRTKKAGYYVFGIYIFCYILRFIEYFYLRIDQTVVGEAFIHKVLGIVLIFIVLKKTGSNLGDIGIFKKGSIKFTVYGLLFGLVAFAIGYGTEILMLKNQGNFLQVKIYASSYAIEQNVVMKAGFIFILICILGNMINVMMEEGMFRGLFPKMLAERGSFFKITTICSVLFGFWHIIGPIRNFLDGLSSFEGMIANCMMLFITSTLVAYKYAMLSNMEGALFMGMADHFVNNTIVNLLHVSSTTGTDELMTVRITVAQSISFCVVLLVFLIHKKRMQVRG